MALTDIYVLPADFPLFDWSDWPVSNAALVPGGYTHEFERACWNAIVDHLAAALTEAGLSWDKTHTTVAEAQIDEAYGALYAKAFNSIRNNIDKALPVLWWGWAHDPNFRGYIGRKDFRGVGDHGEKDADDVYPEYIPELVRKLNLLIEVAKGDKAELAQGLGLSFSLDDVTGRAVPSLPIDGIQGLSDSRSWAYGRVGLSAPAFIEETSFSRNELIVRPEPISRVYPGGHKSRSVNEVKVKRGQGVSIAPSLVSSKSLHSVLVLSGDPIDLQMVRDPSITQDTVTARTAQALTFSGMIGRSLTRYIAKVKADQAAQAIQANQKSKSLCEATAHSKPGRFITPKPTSSKSLHEVLVLRGIPVETQILERSISQAEAAVTTKQGICASAQGLSASTGSATARSAEPFPVRIEDVSASHGVADVASGEPAPVSIEAVSTTKEQVNVSAVRAPSVSAKEKSATLGVATLDTAWLPPIWVDGGLLIRQVQQNVTWLEDGLLILEIDSATLVDGALEVT